MAEKKRRKSFEWKYKEGSSAGRDELGMGGIFELLGKHWFRRYLSHALSTINYFEYLRWCGELAGIAKSNHHNSRNQNPITIHFHYTLPPSPHPDKLQYHFQ